MKELNEYRKKNVELNKELKKLQEECLVLYKQSDGIDDKYVKKDNTRNNLEKDIKQLNDKLKKLQKENEYLKSTLHINNIHMI